LILCGGDRDAPGAGVVILQSGVGGQDAGSGVRRRGDREGEGRADDGGGSRQVHIRTNAPVAWNLREDG
jgi:hypothetical protein